MRWLTRELLLLVLTTVSATTYNDEGCLEGYKRLSTRFCIMVTSPGSWLEAFSSCRLPDASADLDPITFVENDTDRIREHLRREGVSEVWLYPSDYKSLNNEMAQNNITWENGLFYSFHVSRWKWLSSSTNECKTLNVYSSNHNERSCSPEHPGLKLPFVCVLPRRQFRTFTVQNACIDGAFRGFDESNSCYQFDTQVQAELLTAGQYFFPQNYTQCITQEINRTELLARINNFCESEYHNQPGMLERVTTTKITPLSSLFVPFLHNALLNVDRLKNRTGILRKRWTSSGSLSRRREDDTESPSPDTCVICEQPLLPPKPSRRPGMAPSFSLRPSDDGRVGHLKLKLLNFDSNQTEVISCFTDASLSSFTLPNYKITTITISAINKIKFTRKLTVHQIVIEESFFLRLRSNTTNQHTPMLGSDMITELREYKEERKHSLQFVEIPFEVVDEGNYWCVGKDYVTQLPLFSEKVLVEVPSEQKKYQRFLIILETPIKYDPIIYCQKFGAIMARNLNITDANIELKRITSYKDSFIHLLYHVTLQPSHPRLQAVVPKSFNFFIGRNKVIANITAIRSFTSICPAGTLNSSQGFLVNLTATLKGGPEQVISVDIDRFIINVVYVCVGNAIDGAIWKEITSEDPSWRSEWDPSRRFPSVALMDLTSEIHILSGKPIQSDQLPKVTDLIKVLLNRGYGSAADVGHAFEDLDHILSDLNLDPKGSGVVKDVRSSEVAILVSDLDRVNPVVGISLSTTNGVDSIEGITLDDSVRSRRLPKDNAEVFVNLPKTLTSKYKRLSFAVFSNVQSFHSNSSTVRVNSRIVDIVLSNPGKIPDHTKLASGEEIEIYFKPTAKTLQSETRSCAFWDLQNAVWSNQGCTLDKSTNVCRCDHLTHFAQIITGAGARLSPGHQKALEIISIVGCTLSLLSLLVIVATGVVFKAWRQEVGNQVLLNLTAALTLNLVTYLLVHSGVGGNKGSGCIFIGVVMHYSVLACFCWMLVMSGLQVVRLLTIVGNKNTSKLLLKSSLFAWGVPFIPIAILLTIGPSLYASTTDNSIERDFCYPTGVAFYATVLAPVTCIIIVNIVAYVTIMCRLFSCWGWGALNTGIQRHGLSDGIIAMRRIRILVFLFFLFGLTWTFAFLAKYIFFAYLFCITATLQGFVIFIFFFVIEHKSRGYWKAEFFQTPGKQNYKSSDTLSSVTYSTGTHKTSGSKTSWYIENVPIRHREHGSSERLRSKDWSADSPSHEEEPLKPRFSEQTTTILGAFSESPTVSASTKRVSFEVERLNRNLITQQVITLQTTGDTDDISTGNMKDSPKKEPSVDAVEMQGLAGNRDNIVFPDTFNKDSGSESSSSGESRFRENPKISNKILQGTNDALVVNKDNVTIVSVESYKNEDNYAPKVSEIQPTSQQLSLDYQIPTNDEPSVSNPAEEICSTSSNKEESAEALASTMVAHGDKVIGPTDIIPKKRSQFIVSCPITRH